MTFRQQEDPEGGSFNAGFNTKAELSGVKDRLAKLETAVVDLLSELRISGQHLAVMANGHSPNYPGVEHMFESKPNCKIQISSMVANKLLDAIPAFYSKGWFSNPLTNEDRINSSIKEELRRKP